MSTDNLRQKLEVIQKDMSAIQAASKAAGKDVLDEAEASQFDAKLEEFNKVEAQIRREESLVNVQAKLATPQAKPRIEVIEPVYKNTGANGGFKHFSEYLGAVRNAAYGKLDPRLLSNAVTTYGGEAVGPDGGFAVPPDFRASIMEAWGSDDNLIRLFPTIPTSSNMLELVTDETTPHGTTGITAAWTDEAGAITNTKPLLKKVTVTLRKVAALVHLSDEVLGDSPMIGGYVARKMGEKLASVVSDALINGDGNGKPLGIMNSPAIVYATRGTGHTVAAADCGNMVSRLRPGAFSKAFWLMHSSVLPQIWTMTLGQVPVYVPDFTKSPFGTLMGRPVYVTEYCTDLTAATASPSGDILLVNPDGLAVAVKSDGVQTASTIAFAFDQGLQSFRATMRVGATPLLSAAITRKSGSATLSDFVGLSHA